MPLPKCVKVEAKDTASRDALEAEGWRFIGQLDTYSGMVYEQDRARRIFIEQNPEKWERLWKEIDWTGRLWRDKAVSDKDALAATARVLADESLTCYAIGKAPAAFGLFRQRRVVLVGVHWAARGLGLATALVTHAARNQVMTAGTYSDNAAAIALYRSLGMGLVLSQAVFHK